MAVMPACVHHPRVFRPVVHVVEFLDGQGVHVGPEHEGPAGAGTLKDRCDPCRGQTGPDLEAEPGEVAGDGCRRPPLRTPVRDGRGSPCEGRPSRPEGRRPFIYRPVCYHAKGAPFSHACIIPAMHPAERAVPAGPRVTPGTGQRRENRRTRTPPRDRRPRPGSPLRAAMDTIHP